MIEIAVFPSWQSLYADPGELANVQQAIATQVPPGYQIDWQRLLSATRTKSTAYTFPSHDGVYIDEAVARLDIGSAMFDDLVPMPLDPPFLDVRPFGLKRSLYSAHHILTLWQRFSPDVQDALELDADGYRGPETFDNLPDLTAREVAVAYAMIAIVRAAEGAVADNVPAHFYW